MGDGTGLKCKYSTSLQQNSVLLTLLLTFLTAIGVIAGPRLAKKAIVEP